MQFGNACLGIMKYVNALATSLKKKKINISVLNYPFIYMVEQGFCTLQKNIMESKHAIAFVTI